MPTNDIIPSDGLTINRDTKLHPGVYQLPRGLKIGADNITLDGNHALLIGSEKLGHGLTIESKQNITIKNLRIQNYYHGIHAVGCQNIKISNCTITQTAEVEANSAFLNIWLPAAKAYGAAIFLHKIENAEIANNNLQHQMNGLLTYACSQLDVHDNNASYNSGFGFHLYQTINSLFQDNYADFCCRYQLREQGQGHLGADSAGFLIVHRSSHNQFKHNFARLGGDGFFLAGMTPNFDLVACNDNLFEDNDASYSPNNGFEAVFSAGNVFRKNTAMGCNYGFWLGFSQHNYLEENLIAYNRQAGIATEDGFGFKVIGNHFHQNQYGILLWSKYVKEFFPPLPQNNTSYDWLISQNKFDNNKIAIRIAANQDHGIRIMPANNMPAPHNHTIYKNTFAHNQTAIEFENTVDNHITDNHWNNNSNNLIET